MDEKSQHTLEYNKVLDRLAEYTSFSAGETLALSLVPSTDLSEIRRWQTETQEARILFETRTGVTIGGARDVRRVADNAQRGFILQPEDLLDTQATVSAARELRRKLDKARGEFPSLFEIAELIEVCPGLVTAISQTLDERGVVMDSASPKLADIRRSIRIVHDRIQEKLRSLLSSSQNQYIQEPTITSRGGRYVIPLKANHKGRIKGIVHDQSNSGATLWIEPFNTVELNNEYRSLHIAEVEEIQRILAELSALVAEHGDAIKRIVNRLAELDLVFARARYAAVIDASMPEFVQWRSPNKDKPTQETESSGDHRVRLNSRHPGSTIWIRGARHPLLENHSVVPTDLLLDEDTFVILITGPNTGGKTVSLKTTGLMVMMAQTGLHLPAIEAKLTVFENIFADIGDEQSIEQNLSTFSGHMTNIVRMIGKVNDRSLVLLDELGSGTDPAEGAALAQAIVNYLMDKGTTTFVATHFPELKVFATQTHGASNASLLFDLETLMPTYEMTIGMPGRSNALAIGRRLGMDETILDDALALIGSGSSRAESLLDSIYEIREKINSQEAATRIALKQAENQRLQLTDRLLDIGSEQEKILEETRHRAESELEQVRKEIRQLRKKLRDTGSINKLKKIQKKSESIKEESLLKLRGEMLVEEPSRRPRISKKLSRGDLVMVSSLGVKGHIVNIDKREATIAVGRLHMRASLDDLLFKEREKVIEPVNEPVGRRPSPSPGMELDLRGQRVEEGVHSLEQYIDSAFLANLPWVRIIHGKGTGRLGLAVRKALTGNSQVISWEQGRDGEGGAGVTVAKLAGENAH